MKDLRKVLPLLKIGAGRGTYPIYCQYINSKDGKVSTCNGDEYVSVDQTLPFQGSINIFVLEDILKNFDEFATKVKNGKLIISSGSYSSFLNIADFDFPVLKMPKIRMLTIDEDLLRILKEASNFVGKDIYESVCITGTSIVATNRNRVFFHKRDTAVKEPIFLTRRMLSMLASNCKIGTQDNKIIISFDGGYIIAIGRIMDDFPLSKIEEFIEASKKGMVKLCNIAYMQDAKKKLSPIFFGELEQWISLKNNKKKLMLLAESNTNGTAEVVIPSEIEDKFGIDINANILKDVAIDFDVYVNLNRLDKLYLTNDETELVLMGGK